MFDEQRLLNILAIHSLLKEDDDESISLFYDVVTETIAENIVYEMVNKETKEHWRYRVSLIIQDVFDEINEAIGYNKLVAFDFEINLEEIKIEYLPNLNENLMYESRPVIKTIKIDEVIDGR